MSTTFEAELPTAQIAKHPNNPRRKAVADQELVDSVATNGLIEPLVVVPEPGGYLLIAGHRRLDACRKAGHSTAPAIVRTDLTTPGQQLEAMLVENDNRQDLSPIEQAAGYQQLQLEFGYTQKAIAAAVGKDTKTVRARLQLLKLRKPTQTKIHEGQLAIDDALALVEFADDAAATKKLEAALSSQYGNFKYELQHARAQRKQNAEVDGQVEDYKTRGVAEYKLPAGATSVYHLTDATRTAQVGVDMDLHTDCLAYVVTPASTYQGRSIDTVCTDPARHTEQLDVEQQQRIAERDEEASAREAERAAEGIARSLRISTVRDLVGNGTVMSAQLQLVVRSLLPALLPQLGDDALRVYLDAMHVEEEDRWENRWYEAQAKRNAPKLLRHIEDVDRWSPGVLTVGLATVLAAAADDNLTSRWSRIDVTARRYAELLEAAEYDFTDIDKGILAELNGHDEAAAS